MHDEHDLIEHGHFLQDYAVYEPDQLPLPNPPTRKPQNHEALNRTPWTLELMPSQHQDHLNLHKD